MGVVMNISHDISTTVVSSTNYESLTGTGISITPDAALEGTINGLDVLVADTTNAYVVKSITTNTSGYIRARLYVHLLDITMVNSDEFSIFYPRSTTPNSIFTVSIKKSSSGNHQLLATLYDDASVGTFHIVDVDESIKHYIEVYVKRATGESTNDGIFQTWVDGASIGSATNIDNYTKFNNFSYIVCGKVAAETTTKGRIFIDEIVVRDDSTEIGAYNTLNVKIRPENSRNTGLRLYT